MSHRTIALVSALLLGASLLAPGTSAVAQAPTTPPAPAPAPPGQRPPRARHPQILAAGRALRQAANHLERAEHEFGGHRAKALELVKQAEQELREALEYARAHPEEGGAPTK